MELAKRPRRLRKNQNIRRLVRETSLSMDDVIYPLFVVEGSGIKREIPSMPDIYQFSIDRLMFELDEISKLNIPGIILFGAPGKKDEEGSGAWNSNGIVQRALIQAKKRFPELIMVADVCLCGYTNHGHCGKVENHKVLNDASVELLAKTALSYAVSGADIVAPSDMMDGRVGAIRRELERNGMHDTGIMAYSAKYFSSFYGPFRDAACSAPSYGNRSSYQMDSGNLKEAAREVELDIQEGADIVMVKPALSYTDVIVKIKSCFDIPLAAYNVSGEYSMIKAASDKGWLDEKKAATEVLLSIKRAGADIIITYFAKQLAGWLEEKIHM